MNRHVTYTCAALCALLLTTNVRGADQSQSKQGDYPLTTCVVSGEPLGAMGKPVIIDHQGTEVRLCCKACIKEFNKDPEKYLAKLKAAADQKGKTGETGKTGGASGHEHHHGAR